ncbi:Axe2 [Niveomyces insectorum RCEF 264]|uniref:Axe2 n=1 Tax=Niveomyces insectorum RCEF 264 TaxID=1081102 RepID=A0A167XAD0_9HYPO|nr:Axe2 [Niveomyces insectorum RCEF 264]
MRGVFATLASTVTVAAAAAATSNESCATGLYILCGRGSGEAAISKNPAVEPDNTGSAGVLATKIATQIPGSVVAGIIYPAVDPMTETGDLNLTAYYASENAGAKAAIDQVTAYHAACPETKIALIGYSQGAQIIADAVCGGIGDGGVGADFNTDEPLPSSLIEQNVLAIALVADPSHIANTTYDVGNSTQNGVFKRTNTTACNPYSDFMASYCEANDLYCDSGNRSDDHDPETVAYESDVVKFVVDKWKNYTATDDVANATESGSAASPTATAKPGAAAGLVVSQTLLGAGALLAVWTLL